MPNSFDVAQLLRTEIAAAAARLIALDGADYHTAKHKAARQILGESQLDTKLLPDNALIENELRRYNALFLADTQPAHLQHLRSVALNVMEALERFQPLLTGAVLNGTAGQHAEIHLLLFADSAKDIEIYLLNKNLQLDIAQTAHFKGPRYDAVETVSFLWQNEGVHAALYELDDMRGAPKAKADPRGGAKLLRADIGTVRALLATPPTTTSPDQP